MKKWEGMEVLQLEEIYPTILDTFQSPKEIEMKIKARVDYVNDKEKERVRKRVEDKVREKCERLIENGDWKGAFFYRYKTIFADK